jgi:HSP20 family protein
MNLQKLSPWNWFRNESASGENLPAARQGDINYPITRLHSEIDRLFDSMLRDSGWPSLFSDATWPKVSGFLRPKVDIKESNSGYTISMEVPGVEEKDISVQLLNDTLTVSGEKKQETVSDKDKYHSVERRYGSFQRVLCLPENADRDHIMASFKDGILKLEIAKSKESETQTRKIKIGDN